MTVQFFSNPTTLDFLKVAHKMRANEREQYEAFVGPYEPDVWAADTRLRPGPSWVAVRDDEPLLVCGFDCIRPGVWQDWLVSTDAAWEPRNWKPITRHLRKLMDKMFEGDVHRLQCISLSSRIKQHEWYRLLGLGNPVLLEAYGLQGQDALMFSRVKKRG